MANTYLNPWNDPDFVADVEAEIEGGIADAGELQRRLSVAYPDVLVRRRGLAGEPESWYIYRDGRWVNPVGARRADSPGSPAPPRSGRFDRVPAVAVAPLP